MATVIKSLYGASVTGVLHVPQHHEVTRGARRSDAGGEVLPGIAGPNGEQGDLAVAARIASPAISLPAYAGASLTCRRKPAVAG